VRSLNYACTTTIATTCCVNALVCITHRHVWTSLYTTILLTWLPPLQRYYYHAPCSMHCLLALSLLLQALLVICVHALPLFRSSCNLVVTNEVRAPCTLPTLRALYPLIASYTDTHALQRMLHSELLTLPQCFSIPQCLQRC
jgi:hypothetical protein